MDHLAVVGLLKGLDGVLRIGAVALPVGHGQGADRAALPRTGVLGGGRPASAASAAGAGGKGEER